MPTDAPISRTESLSAEATPWSSGGNEPVIAAVPGVIDKPIPAPTTISPGRIDRYPPSTDTIEATSASPPAAIENPIMNSARVPVFLAISGATADSGIIANAIGNMPAVAFTAPHPSTPMRNWVMTRNMPIMTMKIRNSSPVPADNMRFLNTSTFNSGFSCWRS